MKAKSFWPVCASRATFKRGATQWNAAVAPNYILGNQKLNFLNIMATIQQYDDHYHLTFKNAHETKLNIYLQPVKSDRRRLYVGIELLGSSRLSQFSGGDAIACTLARAKSRAVAANDINNCKQVMLATAMYVSDNVDFLPATRLANGNTTAGR